MTIVKGTPTGPSTTPLYLINHEINETPSVLAKWFNLPVTEDDLQADQQYAFFRFGAVHLGATLVLKNRERRACGDVFQAQQVDLDLARMGNLNFPYILDGELYVDNDLTPVEIMRDCLPLTNIILVDYVICTPDELGRNHRIYMRAHDRPGETYQLRRNPHAPE